MVTLVPLEFTKVISLGVVPPPDAGCVITQFGFSAEAPTTLPRIVVSTLSSSEMPAPPFAETTLCPRLSVPTSAPPKIAPHAVGAVRNRARAERFSPMWLP